MQHRFIFFGFMVLASAGLTLTVQAQEADVEELDRKLEERAARIEELERKLEERDKVTLELLERVEAFERRLGMPRSAPTVARDEEQGGAGQAATPAGEVKPDRLAQSEPGKVVAKEGEVERALERSLTQTGALLLPPGILEVDPSFAYRRLEDASPLFLTSNEELRVGEEERNIDSLSATLNLRLGLPWDSQLEIGLPYRWRRLERVANVNFSPIASSSEWGDGLGDLRVGLAKTL